MERAAESRTSVGLLCKLGEDPTAQAAWNRFVERYSPRIRGWRRRRCFSLEPLFRARDDLLASGRRKGRRGLRQWCVHQPLPLGDGKARAMRQRLCTTSRKS